jgi:hypothetical protein
VQDGEEPPPSGTCSTMEVGEELLPSRTGSAAEGGEELVAANSSLMEGADELVVVDTEPGPLAEDLMALWLRLGPNPQWHAQQWAADGCPPVYGTNVHFTFHEKLKPFREAVLKATAPERQRFLELSALQQAA